MIALVCAVPAEGYLDVMVNIFPLFTSALFSDIESGTNLYQKQIPPLLKERGNAISNLINDTLDPEFVELASFGIWFVVAMNQTF